ncbi:MAG: ATP-binding protein [Flavobacteriales bacterium CG_4_9_14_0_2_um_filter_32_27]|nr:MAG: ATP-binding protein [Flavobacteriales bacterium CG_4_10_14_0_8_um_filter_32_5]PJC61533.1 MAG: ATP-binding protein [Flavobacteriales bacterium CG_4_9_14_0_2_um_filter_32_27]
MMNKIKIKNFGPIKNGYQDSNGWLEVNKVTVFIGNQGSGKSTVAKLISTFMWLEKALIRGDIKTPVSHQDFIELIEFHRLENYLQPNTQIEYEGATYRLVLSGSSNKKSIEATKLNKKSVKQPKIMYVPAERNFLSSITNINKVSDLIVGSLKNYSVEFRNAQLAHKGKPIELPINNTKVVYDPKDDENYLVFDDKRLKLSDASSGFHSIVPLHWVTKYLIEFVKQGEKKLLELLSTDQTIRRNNELKALNTLGLVEKTLRSNEKKINEKYVSKYFVNIVEEPEQNLFPSSQRLLLNQLLAYNNGNNLLIITTHSPYLINYLTLSVKAEMVKQKLNSEESKRKLAEIVPLEATLSPENLVIYELNEKDGSIRKLSDYKGLPSDENFLNNSLEDSNELFSQLQEIEKGWR